jgi:hypothetical protein
MHQAEGLAIAMDGHSSGGVVCGDLLEFDSHSEPEFAYTDRPDAFCMICHGFSLGSSCAYVILASPVVTS